MTIPDPRIAIVDGAMLKKPNNPSANAGGKKR